MSAAFLYVSPVAKAVDEHGQTIDKKDYHLAHGGYYDNYGGFRAGFCGGRSCARRQGSNSAGPDRSRAGERIQRHNSRR